MKNATKRSKWLKGLALFVFMSFLPALSKAQCPNNLINTLPCPVDVKVEIFDWIPPNICNPNPCASYPLNVPPGAAIPFMCPCPTVCDVRVTVVAIGGMPAGPTTADFTTAPPGAPIPVAPGPCAPAGGPGPFIHYNGVDFVITP